jgi:hypothetical protein
MMLITARHGRRVQARRRVIIRDVGKFNGAATGRIRADMETTGRTIQPMIKTVIIKKCVIRRGLASVKGSKIGIT